MWLLKSLTVVKKSEMHNVLMLLCSLTFDFHWHLLKLKNRRNSHDIKEKSANPQINRCPFMIFNVCFIAFFSMLRWLCVFVINNTMSIEERETFDLRDLAFQPWCFGHFFLDMGCKIERTKFNKHCVFQSSTQLQVSFYWWIRRIIHANNTQSTLILNNSYFIELQLIMW